MSDRRTLASGLALICALFVPPVLAQARGQGEGAQALPETVGAPRDAASRAEAMRDLQERLAADEVAAALEHALTVEITLQDRQRIDRDGSAERRYLVGVAAPAGVTVDLAAAGDLVGTVEMPFGAARGGATGIVWSGVVRSPGATALRLHIEGLALPAGAELYVYNATGQAFGPYTGSGPLGDDVLHTNTVFGSELRLQLRAPAGAAAARFEIAEVGVMGSRFAAARLGPLGQAAMDALTAPLADASNLCPDNADCVQNAACVSTGAVTTAKDAVASILFLSGGSYYICTGGLVADTVATSVIPYFLTAHHCISSSNEASSVETYFDYATTCSNPDCTQPYNSTGETVGATIMSTSSNTDHSLLQLSAAPTTPDGVAGYLGWNSTAVANTNGTHLYRISHPQGSPQAYSEQDVDTGKPTCGGLPRGNFIYSEDVLGATEGGSSGSPVVNGAGQIVGQLYGACGFNIGDVCDAASNATVDGAFAAYYASVAPFLNPGGGGSCKPRGQSCTANSECCSGSCKGKPGRKTCR